MTQATPHYEQSTWASKVRMMPPESEQPTQSPSSDDRIAAAMKRKRTARSRVFDTHLPLSWTRILRALVSYALLFSDVPRSGIGVRDLASRARTIEPDTFIEFGPWAYPVQHLYRNETSELGSSAKVWNYKLDTTSLVWRTFAEFFALEAFPACLLYRSKCASDYLSSSVVFKLIDSVPTAISQARTPRLGQPVAVTLRTQSFFFDKLHHYVLPRVFLNPTWRTHQAFYYPSQLLTRTSFGICSAVERGSRPNFCMAQWTNYRLSCLEYNVACQSVGSVASHVLGRLRALQTQFPDSQVDLTIFESEEAPRVIHGGICYVSRRDADVSTILRVRSCSVVTVTSQEPRCETILVDDYRYEVVLVTSDVVQWYFLVASLRAVGQSYFLLRTLALFLSCYATRAAEDKYAGATLWTRLKAAGLLFVRVPCQCVIHGSTFPILCYVCAHVIDAPLTYDLVVGSLMTSNGLFHMSLWEFCLIAAVQMRSLWLLVLFLQCLMATLTLRRYPEWTPAHGILGVPGLSVSIVSSWTVFGQYRSLSLRQTPVISIDELPVSSSTPQAIKHHFALTQRGAGNTLLEGLVLDFKLYLCVFALVAMLAVVLAYLVDPLQRAYYKLRAKKGDARRRARAESKPSQQSELHQSTAMAWTPVPYSARALWPITAVAARWRGSLFSDPGHHTASGFFFELVKTTNAIFSSAPVAPEPSTRASISSKRSRMSTITGTRAPSLASPPKWTSWPKSDREIDTLRFLQFHLENLSTRHEDVDAVVALFNLVLMSDPLVFFTLQVRGQPLAFYETTSGTLTRQTREGSDRIALLPRETAVTCFKSHELTLLRELSSTELSWSDLIHCG